MLKNILPIKREPRTREDDEEKEDLKKDIEEDEEIIKNWKSAQAHIDLVNFLALGRECIF